MCPSASQYIWIFAFQLNLEIKGGVSRLLAQPFGRSNGIKISVPAQYRSQTANLPNILHRHRQDENGLIKTEACKPSEPINVVLRSPERLFWSFVLRSYLPFWWFTTHDDDVKNGYLAGFIKALIAFDFASAPRLIYKLSHCLSKSFYKVDNLI